MGNNNSTNTLDSVPNDERTLSVTPGELVNVCSALSRAQIQVNATSIPDESRRSEGLVWVKDDPDLSTLLQTGILRQHVTPTNYRFKGNKVTSLPNNTTGLGMLEECKKMMKDGKEVLACSSVTELGPKKIYHS